MDVIKDKDILLEKMLDPEATLTDAELRLILADEELREIHEVSAAVRGASIQPVAIDVEKEWGLFRHKIHPKPTRWRWAMRVAAIFLGVLFVSAIVKVGIDRLMTADAPTMYSSEAVPSSNAASTLRVSPRASEATRVRPTVAERNPKKKASKISVPVLTREDEIEVDEYLRLQQARIDNDLAMMQAELYIEELQALTVTLPSEEGEENPESLEIRYLIMQ